jgi:hypothetical protein
VTDRYCAAYELLTHPYKEKLGSATMLNPLILNLICLAAAVVPHRFRQC